MTGAPLPREGPQRRALARAFLYRFFENEITGGSSDLRASFFWLLSVLIPPGLCTPFLAIWDWTTAAYTFGPDGLRRLAWTDKTLYLGFSMVVAGAVSAVIWNALLVDRRDALVLGVQPVRGRTIVSAKVLALIAYTGIVVVGMHTCASFSYGVLLGNWSGAAFALRNIFAHFVASCLASAFVFFAICGLQGVCLLLLGPRRFARVSPVLQLSVVVAVLALLVALPTISASAVRSLEAAGVVPLTVQRRFVGLVTVHATTGAGAVARAWVPYAPPIWFLGVYEWILGGADPVLARLAATALVATLGALALTLVTYPLAYQRMAVAAVESVDTGLARRGRLSRALPALISRHPTTQAATQFLLATLGRVERHRFVVAMTAGVAAAWAVPVVVSSLALFDAPPRITTVRLLSVPFSVMVILTVGLHLAASLPGDERASWIFRVIAPDPWRARAAVWRVCFLVAVLPIELVAAVVAWRSWGGMFALTNALVGLVLGALLVEILLNRLSGMPCAYAWRPRTEHLRAWWPVYFFGFLIFTGLPPALPLVFTGHIAALA
ncbi:MAG: hypothetical protein ACHQO8_11790, partial [Vicinamibacterales bacterium]